MDRRQLAVIHADPRSPWQPKWAGYFAEGFRRAGIPAQISSDRFRHDEGFPVLLGTTFWREIEKAGPFLLVDRCSFGNADTNVSLVWNGHGGRGEHRVPETYGASRWERYGVPLEPWKSGERIVLCGQTETYSPHWQSLESWYGSVAATHFKPHPAGANPTGLPSVRDFGNARAAITLNSSVGVACLLGGIPVVTCDEGAMAWDITGHSLDDIRRPDRLPWCHWLAHTQFTDDEIREGAWVSRW